MLQKLKSNHGSALIETAVLSLFFIGSVIYATTASLSLFDTTREGRAIALSSSMLSQLIAEDPSPTTSDFDNLLQILVDTNYFRPGEQYRMIVSTFENPGGSGHVRTGFSQHGPNAGSTSRVQAHADTDPTPGVEIQGRIYTLASTERLFVVELFSGTRGSRVEGSGELPYYEFGVVLTGP
jgi:hypothetical protein